MLTFLVDAVVPIYAMYKVSSKTVSVCSKKLIQQ